MKKKLIGILLIITIIICVAAGLSACGKSETPSEETNYTDGNGEENNNTGSDDEEEQEEQEEQIEAPELDDMEDGVVYISDFSIKYTSAADSPNGEINESKLSSQISGSVEEYFMVIDFTMQMNEVNTARQTLTLTVKIYDDEVIYGTIDSAPTSNYTEVTKDNITTISLTFTLPETAGEAKTVRTVIDLTPKTEGVVDISYGMECESKKISGCPETDETFTIASSTMSTAKTSLEYTLNDDNQSYSVTGIGTKTGGETYIRETYGGLPVTAIAEGAFKNCSALTKLYIPDSITSIGSYAFGGCTSLASITVDTGNMAYKSVDGNLYNYDGTQFIQYAAGQSTTSFVLPDSVTYVCEGAFSGCSLKSITLPFVGDRIKTSEDTYQYPFGYIFGTSSYTGGATTKQYYYGSSTSEATNETYYIPTALTSVTITGGEILYGAFRSCSHITSVTIGDGVTSIGSSAFRDCTSLTSIDIHDSVTSFGDYAFYCCKKLTSVTIGDSVTSIDVGAFGGCASLTSITIPDSVTFIGGGAFSDCTSLESVIISDSETVIRDRMFYGCTALASITIPDGVTSIGSYVFYNCISLVSLTIPDSVTSIGDRAFGSCTSLTSITIPDSVTSVSTYVFNGCTKLASVTIGNGVTSILDGMFYNCTSLTSITISDGVTSIGGYVFYGCSTLESINIPDGVTEINEYTFYNCSSLTSVTIPDSVISFGDYAFYNCTAEIIWGENPTITEIGNYAFAYYAGTGITIPNSVTTIGSGAFYSCTSFASITIPDNVTSIGGSAFSGCTSLTRINSDTDGVYIIPDSVTSIGSAAFGGCSALTSITLPFVGGSVKTSTDTYQYPFGYIFGSSSYTGGTATKQYYHGSSTSSVTDDRYYIPTTLTTVTITGGNIPYGAFYNCTALTSVTIDNGVTSIGNYAFYNCMSLTSITIPNSVTSIGSAAFGGCSALTSITLPFVGDSVKTSTDTYQYPFGYIFGTSSYTGGISTYQVYYGSSANLQNNSTYYIPATLTSVTITGGEILYSAFRFCSNITSVTIGDGVTSIGQSAFSGCTSLESITIPDSVTSIGDYAFYDCTSLTSVTFENTNGWYVTETQGASSGTNILSSDLSKTATAATYLKSTYYLYYWYRSE